MHKIFSKTSLHVLSGMGMKFVNALMLVTILFSNITGSVQARTESNDVSESVARKTPAVIEDIYNPSSFTRPESRTVEGYSDSSLKSNFNGSGTISAERDSFDAGLDPVSEKQFSNTPHSYQNNDCAQPPTGLIDWWTAEGDWNDIVGEHHGTPQGGVTFAPGKVGQAFSFDGIDDYIDLGSWFTYQDFTITMWVKPGSTQNTYADIMDNNHRYGINWVIQQNGGTTNQYYWGQDRGQVFDLTADQWQHLAVVHDSSGNYSEYLNGNLSGHNNSGTINYTYYNYLLFGRWGGGEGRNWKGLLDEIDMYNRALSGTEVASLFNAGDAGKCLDLANSTVAITPSNTVANGVNSATITVTLKNVNGNSIPNRPVEIALSSGAELYINNQLVDLNEYTFIGTTNTNGMATAILKTHTAGTRTIVARSGQDPVEQHGIAEFVPGDISAITSLVTSDIISVPADGQSSITVTVTAFDSQDNPIPDANVILQPTGNAVITQPATSTNNQGKASGQVVNTSGETVTVSATVNGVLLDDTVNLTFSSGDLALTMTAPESAVPNSDIQYTVKLRQYEMAAENVMLTVQMPPGVTFIAQNLPFPLDEEGQTLTWSLGTLDPGERLDFTIFANVIPSANVGDSLQVQAEASTTSLDDNSSNNLVTASTQVVDGRSFSSTVEPDSKTINTDAEAIYSILINNTGLIADTFAITVKDAGNINELNPAWYTLSDSQVTLAPGETRPVELALNFSLQPDKCAFPANIPFFVNVSNSNSIVVTSPAEVNLQLGPVVTDVYPENNPLNPLPSFGSRDVTFSWKTDAQTTGKLYVYPVGQQPGPNDIRTTTASISHSVTVTGLTRNTVTYEWYVEATADCETTTTTPTQHFTIGNGIVFNSHDQFYIINRDYEQVINDQDVTSVKVTNQDSEARNVHLEIKEPYEDLIVNFRGSGSVDGDITLLKGETRTIELVFHAQDAEIKDENYVINAVLTSTNTDGTDTVSDLAVIRVKVLFPGDYTIEEYSIDPVLNITTYRIKNTGMPISDLTITAEDPQTYLPARVMITPQIYHARLEKNGELFFRVIPLYGTDQVANTVDTGSSQRVMASPSRDALNNIFYNLVSEVAGVAKRTTIAKSCGEGKQVYAVTFDGPVSMTMPYDTWYCPNRAHIKIELFTPPIVDGSNLLGGALQMNFSPASAAEVHTVSIGLNGSPLGNMQGVPKGLYSFNLSPSDINTSFMTSAQQTIAVDANFPNFAHYQIGTGGNLIFFLDSPTVYVCAASVEEARQIAEDLYNIRPLPNTMDVEIELPNQGLPAALDQNGFVNIRAVINDNLTTYSDVYSVSAEIEYLDVPGTPVDKITLFNDGAGIHGDTTATDRHFNTLWEPRFGGDMKLTVTATAGSQLTDTDTEYFSVDAKPDFEVEKVSTQRISPTGQAAVVTAQIRNNGFTVNGPIAVEFLYYRTENNQKIGDPIHTQRYEIFKPVLGYSAPFIHGESTTVEDNTFIALGVDFLYYVEVVVDPGPSIVPIP